MSCEIQQEKAKLLVPTPRHYGRIVFWSGMGRNANILQKQKCWYPHLGTMFALFFGQAWDEMGQKCQYLAQNDQICIFWAKLGHLWAKNPNSFGVSIHKTENYLGNLFKLFFGRALDQMGQNCPHMVKNASFGPNLAVFGLNFF